MKKFIYTTLLATVITFPVMAGQTANITVNGLVCDFCARALEKTFGKRDEVTDIVVDLNSKIVTINFEDDQNIDDEELKQIIKDSGYDVETINRTDAQTAQ